MDCLTVTILEIANLDRNAVTRVDLDTADEELHEERLRCMREITELQQEAVDVAEEILSPTCTQGRPTPDGGIEAALVVKGLLLRGISQSKSAVVLTFMGHYSDADTIARSMWEKAVLLDYWRANGYDKCVEFAERVKANGWKIPAGLLNNRDMLDKILDKDDEDQKDELEDLYEQYKHLTAQAHPHPRGGIEVFKYGEPWGYDLWTLNQIATLLDWLIHTCKSYLGLPLSETFRRPATIRKPSG